MCASPAGWPLRSLICLSPSRSIAISVNGCAVSARVGDRDAEVVLERAVVSETRQRVGPRLRGELVDAPLMMALDAAAVAAHDPEEKQRPLDRGESGGTDLDVHEDARSEVDPRVPRPARRRARRSPSTRRRRARPSLFRACDGESASRMSVPYLLLSPLIGRPCPHAWSAARSSCISWPLSASISLCPRGT